MIRKCFKNFLKEKTKFHYLIEVFSKFPEHFPKFTHNFFREVFFFITSQNIFYSKVKNITETFEYCIRRILISKIFRMAQKNLKIPRLGILSQNLKEPDEHFKEVEKTFWKKFLSRENVKKNWLWHSSGVWNKLFWRCSKNSD